MQSVTADPVPATHSFTLILSGVSALTQPVRDALFEAGCDDALLGIRDGVAFLDFDREGTSFREALFTAIAQVEGAGIDAHVVRVEPDELVTAAEIARRTGRSRESIRQLILGERGPGGFPAPVSALTARSPIWKWTEVVHWFMEHFEKSRLGPLVSRDKYSLIAAVNAVLDLRRHVPTLSAAMNLWKSLNRPGHNRPPARRDAIPGCPTGHEKLA
jgi:hypothetical protein